MGYSPSSAQGGNVKKGRESEGSENDSEGSGIEMLNSNPNSGRLRLKNGNASTGKLNDSDGKGIEMRKLKSKSGSCNEMNGSISTGSENESDGSRIDGSVNEQSEAIRRTSLD